MENTLLGSFDLTFERIRQAYVSKGHEINEDTVRQLAEIRRLFENKKFVVPLAPFYVKSLLKFYNDFRDSGLNPSEDYDRFGAGYNVLGKNSMSSFFCREPFIGINFFEMAKKFYFPHVPKISYSQVYENLSWEAYDEMLSIAFMNIPLFTSYNDGINFQKHLEFATITSLFSTRVSSVLELNEEEKNHLFLSLLFKDIGLAVLYWECPLCEGENQQRSLRSNPDITIDKDLFDALLYHLHPLLSAQACRNFGFDNDLVQDILDHHLPIEKIVDTSKTVRLNKFINTFTDFGIMKLNQKHMLEWSQNYRLDIKDFLLDEIITAVQSVKLTNLDQSLIDPEAGSVALTTDYEVLDSTKGGYFVSEDNVYFMVNLIQDVKDQIKNYLRKTLFYPQKDMPTHLEKTKKISILNAFYNSENLEEAARSIKMPVDEVQKELDKAKLSI